MRTDVLARVIEKAGSASALARTLQISPAAVNQWRRVPAARAADIERATGIPRHELRPDLWEPPPSTNRAA